MKLKWFIIATYAQCITNFIPISFIFSFKDTSGAQNSNTIIGNHQIGQHVSPEITEALRFQEQRLEQALRLHGNDPRALGFSLGNHQSQQLQ